MDDELLKKAAGAYPDHIYQPFIGLIELIGYESVCSLSEEFGGSLVYIPAKKFIFKKCLEKAIADEFDGGNYRQLAKRYGYSVRGVRDILKKNQ